MYLQNVKSIYFILKHTLGSFSKLLKDGTIIARIAGIKNYRWEVVVEYIFSGKRKAINELISEIELILLCERDYKVCRQL